MSLRRRAFFAVMIVFACAVGFVAAQMPDSRLADLIFERVVDRDPEVRLAQDSIEYERLAARRIDIVDSDGTIRMTIAGELPNPVVDGVMYRRDAPVSGIMLRDDRGNERGGFGYSSVIDGPVLALDHGTNEAAGFAVVNGEARMFLGAPAEPLTDERLPGRAMPGRSAPSNIELSINKNHRRIGLTDEQGRTRLRLTVTEQGHGAIEFLDAQGDIIHALAPESIED